MNSGDIELDVLGSGNPLLSLPASTLSLNMHLNGLGTSGFTTVTNSGGILGGFTTSFSGNSLNVVPSGTTVAGNSSTILNLGWAITSAAGPQSATLSISNTTNPGDLSTPTSQTITGGVYAFAAGSLSSNSLTFNVHAGSGASSGLSLSNVGPNSSGYTESLFTTGFSNTSNVSGSGSLVGLVQGATSGGLTVGYNAGSVGGVYTGTATLGLASSEVNGSGLGTTPVSSQTVNVTADVYNLASGALLTNSVTLYMHAGSGTSSGLSLSNVGPNSSGYTETLFTTGFNANNSFSGNGAVSGLAQGSTSNGLSVAYNAGSVGGAYTGTATLGLASSEVNGSGLGTTGLSSQQVNLTADVYNLASGALFNELGHVVHARRQRHVVGSDAEQRGAQQQRLHGNAVYYELWRQQQLQRQRRGEWAGPGEHQQRPVGRLQCRFGRRRLHRHGHLGIGLQRDQW